MKTSSVLGLAATLMVLATGCSAREKTWKNTWPSYVRLHEAMWGAPPEPAAAEEARARFDCIWDGMEKRGRDPAPDVNCWARRMDQMVSCTKRLDKAADAERHSKVMAACIEATETACPLSEAYEKQAKACQGEGGERKRPTQ